MKVREIVLDTETTGLDADGGDRIIEIGCVELVDFVATGQIFHEYVDPERDISIAATKVHGITKETLLGKPKFKEIAQKLLDFIQDSTLIIHNARFDLRFLEVELERFDRNYVIKNKVVDTLEVARTKFPGMPASLDALCKRFNISTQDRQFHGALKDASLLAKVYIELHDASQRRLMFSQEQKATEDSKEEITVSPSLRREFPVCEKEIALHRECLKKINNPIWNLYLEKAKA
ncbi:DNA polymerase III subunit epsilon [Candidatus Anaplasma sp. TIGMIC]|uniref:DNA polymerase III subunit epsilon n=1 Tax=Candidatus Anaplasma sp. TIGMIC TaxID=3020713 RepID=UPI002330F1F7|nr:DNA polymerase III subunit epsilon [Candidatus Anaplasma sp. TIGMIC]MDB1135643.1 DNA polymerase III subunit epsilon [Candidatus Anaplasma sp. TIGMIC]